MHFTLSEPQNGPFGALNRALNGGLNRGYPGGHSEAMMKGCLDVSAAVAHDNGMQHCFVPPLTAPDGVPKGVPKGAPFGGLSGYPIWGAKSAKMAFWSAEMGAKSVKSPVSHLPQDENPGVKADTRSPDGVQKGVLNGTLLGAPHYPISSIP